MRLLYSLTVIAICAAALGACNQSRRVATLSAPPAAELLLALKGGLPDKTHGARLNYEVLAPTGAQPMQLTDPGKPLGTLVELEHATLRIHPFVCKPKLNSRQQKAAVAGCYTLCVRDSRGVHVGDFEVNDLGAMVLKPDTADKSLDIERITTVERTVFFVYDKLPGGQRSAPILGLEFQPHETQGGCTVAGGDDWHYSFSSPDGRLIVYKAQGLGHLPDQMAGIAEDQARQLAAVYAETKRLADLGRSAGGGGGGPCRTGGG